MTESEQRNKTGLLLVAQLESKKRLAIIEEDYRNLTDEVGGLHRLLKSMSRDVAIEVYEEMFRGGSFRRVLEDYKTAFDDCEQRDAAVAKAFPAMS